MRGGDQATGYGFCAAQALPGEILGNGSSAVDGDSELQPHSTVSAPPGLDGPSHRHELALPALHDGGNSQRESGGDDDSLGCARGSRTGLVAEVAGEDDQSDPQLQFNWPESGDGELWRRQ